MPNEIESLFDLLRIAVDVNIKQADKKHAFIRTLHL